MTRIISGSVGGRRISVPPSGTRPTSDRVREALFSALDHEVEWSKTHVADLYAGSGALGLEASSRGATHSLLVDNSRTATKVIQANIDVLGLKSVALITADVGTLVGATPPHALEPRDLVFLDPPYEVSTEHLVSLLEALAANGWLANGALVVVERGVRGTPLAWPEGFVPIRERKYSDTVLWFGRFVDS